MHLVTSARRSIGGLLESASVLCLAAGGSVLCAAPAQGGTAADLDIKPGSCPNPLNRGSHGFLPVALVGTAGFDVTQVDLSSLVLVRKDDVGGAVSPNEGPPGPHSVFEDVATPFTGKDQCDCAELRGDGILDLSLKFRTQDVVIALELNDLPPGEFVSLVLMGTLLDGTPFEADDCVWLVPPTSVPIPTGVGVGPDLDIKPGSCPNPLNRMSRGFLPVALVGTAGFDVTQVDLSSLVLVRKDDVGGAVSPNEGPPGPHSVVEDVATPFTGKTQCDCAELRGDGILDLSLKFRSRDVVIALELNDVPPGEFVSLVVTGLLLDGTSFEADDCILIVPPVLTPGR